MEDDRVRERAGVVDPVGPERDEGRSLEDTQARRGRGDDEREVDRDHDQEARAEAHVEVEREQREPERGGEEEPRGDGDCERAQGEPRPVQSAQAPHQARGGEVEALAVDPRQGDERPEEEAHRPGLPAGKDEDRGERERDEDDGEDRRAPQPGDVRQERRGGKEEDEEREDVVDPLADGGCERLGARGAGCLVEREDADRLARSRRQDVVEEVADEERARGRADRGARSRREEQAPAQRANEDGQREDGQGRHEPGRVALPQPVPEDVEVDRTDRKVGEDERDDEPDDREQRA